MKSSRPRRFTTGVRGLLAGSSIAVLVLAASPAVAVDQTWLNAGPSDVWNIEDPDLNWDAGVAWTPGNSAIFGGTGETITLATAITADDLTFNSTGFVITDNILTLEGTPTMTVTNTLDSTSISSIIAGTVGLTKAGAGTLALFGTNTYTGNTAISGGTLLFAGAGTLGASGSYAGNIALTSGAQFAYASSATQTLTGTVTGSGGTVSVSNGTLRFSSSANDRWGTGVNLSIGSGATFEFVSARRFSGGAMNITGAGTFKYGGSGTAFLANGPAYQAINMLADGLLWVTSGVLSDFNIKTTNLGDLKIDAGATLQQPLANEVYVNALNGAGTYSFSTDLSKPFGLRVGVNNGNGDFSGIIKDANATLAVPFTKVGVGTQILSGANTYRGATNVQNGVLQLGGADNRLSSSTVLTLGNSTTSGILVLGSTGVSDVTDSQSNLTVAGLQTSGTGTANAIVGGNAAISILTVNLASAPNTYTGSLGGAGTNENNIALIKSGAGVLTLTGTNTYTGPTTVSAGTLRINGSASGSAYTVNPGATLGGTGTISGEVSVSGILAPGASIESLTTGSLSMADGSSLALEIQDTSATGADLVAITGDFSFPLSGVVTLNLQKLGGATWSVDNKLTLASYTGTWDSGLFTYAGNLLADDSTFTFDGQLWAINYDDTVEGSNYQSDSAGNYVTMTAVPEPGAMTAMLGGLGVLLGMRRRRSA